METGTQRSEHPDAARLQVGVETTVRQLRIHAGQPTRSADASVESPSARS